MGGGEKEEEEENEKKNGNAEGETGKHTHEARNSHLCRQFVHLAVAGSVGTWPHVTLCHVAWPGHAVSRCVTWCGLVTLRGGRLT